MTGYRNLDEEIAQIGIFIFSEDYRGLGLEKTLVWCSVYLINKCSNSTFFGAGMHISNISSFKSFRSCGFKTIQKDNQNMLKFFFNIKIWKIKISLMI